MALSHVNVRCEVAQAERRIPIDGKKDVCILEKYFMATDDDASSQVANPRNAFCIEQRASNDAKRAIKLDNIKPLQVRLQPQVSQKQSTSYLAK